MRTQKNNQGTVDVVLEYNEFMDLLDGVMKAGMIAMESSIELFRDEKLDALYLEFYDKVKDKMESCGLGMPRLMDAFYFRIMEAMKEYDSEGSKENP